MKFKATLVYASLFSVIFLLYFFDSVFNFRVEDAPPIIFTHISESHSEYKDESTAHNLTSDSRHSLNPTYHNGYSSQPNHSHCIESEWIKSLYERKWVYELYPDTTVEDTPKFVSETEFDTIISALCDGKWLMNSTTRIWRGDGGGLETRPQYQSYHSGMLDEPDCALSMGHYSKPMDDKKFIESKFLAIYYFPEQTTKAMRHLRAAISYAKKMKRILILPRVGSKTRAGTVSMGGYLPLCTYFKVAITIDWVSYEYYYSTALRLNHIPHVGFKCHYKEDERKCLFDYDSELSPLRLIPLIALTRGQYPHYNNTIAYSCFHGSKCTYNSSVVKDKKGEAMFWKRKNLMVLTKTVSRVAVYQVTMHVPVLKFSPKLIQTANTIADSLNNYVSIHLRLEHLTYHKFSMEKVKYKFMKCANLLVSQAKKYVLSKQNSTKFRFYLASDVSNYSVQSSSWLPEYMNSSLEAFYYIKKHLNFVMLEDLNPDYGKLDNGIHGILDKIICAKADVFFTATKTCGGFRSFDLEILNFRKDQGKSNDTIIHWGI